MRQISRLSVIAVSTALLITLSSCSSTQSTLEADDQPSTPIENREMTTDVQENKANGDSPQGSVTDAANFEITENKDGTVKGALASIGIVVMVIASQFAMCLLPFFFAFIFRDIGKSNQRPEIGLCCRADR